MQNFGRVHRFRDHAVAGVNFRPTRFVDEVPGLRLCGLCRMIPKRTLALPCGHLLCQSCHAASSQGCRGRCPLDQEPFEAAECDSYDLPSKKANALKVYCWNEAHGCEFEGSMEDMLRHYENECKFHTVECLRCGEKVLHRELSTHYVAGCRTTVSSAGAGNASSNSQALTLQGVTAAFEELKTLLRDANHEQLLPAIQSQMNKLIEQIRKQESRSAVITRAVTTAATSELAQVPAPSPSTSLQNGTSRPNPTEEASTPSTSRPCSEKTLMPRQLETLADLPQKVLQAMRKTSSQDYPQHAITRINGDIKCHLGLAGLLSTAVTWREVLGTVKYILSLSNVDIRGGYMEYNFANVTVLHTRDASFTVELYSRSHELHLEITFHGMRGDSGCVPPVFVIKAYNLSTGKIVQMSTSEERWNCKHDRDLWTHRRRIYCTALQNLAHKGTGETGIKFEIELHRP